MTDYVNDLCLLQIMKTLHHQCALVHADLSDYNLLWHDGKVYVIDVSQAVDLTHPQAFNFLFRDCCNISTVSCPSKESNSFLTGSWYQPVADTDVCR